MTIRLDVHGVSVVISATSVAHAPLLASLREDLGWFEVPEGGAKPEIHFDFSVGAGSGGESLGRRLFATKMCSVHGWGSRRICDYGGGLRIEAENASRLRRFRLFDPEFRADGAEAYEVAYTTLLSAIGEALDQSGFHRVHALGFAREGEGWLVVLPSGGGKSALAAHLLGDPSVRLLSDEMPLMCEGQLYPFPVRLALDPESASRLLPAHVGRPFRRRLYREKLLFPIERDRVSPPVPLRHLFVPGLTTLGGSVVVGLGLAQMTEHMLRLESLPRLAAIACSRAREAVRMAGLGSPTAEAAEWLQARRAECTQVLASAKSGESQDVRILSADHR